MGIVHKKVLGRQKVLSVIPHPLTIGVLGAIPGVGGTHLSLMLGTYWSQFRGKRVAVTEQSEDRALDRLCRARGAALSELGYFTYCHVDYYPLSGGQTLVEILSRPYDIVIVDFGHTYKAALNEFLRCQQKIVLCHLQEWRIEGFSLLLEQILDPYIRQSLIYATCFYPKEYIKQAEKKWGVHFFEIPFCPDPFTLSRGGLPYLEKLSQPGIW